MEKVKGYKSLKWRLLPYMFGMLVVAFAGVMAIGLTANKIQDMAHEAYGKSEIKFYYETVDVEGEKAYLGVGYDSAFKNSKYGLYYKLADAGQVILGVLWVVMCFAGSGLLFYRYKLKYPLELLMDASDKIAVNNLDFEIGYKSPDEMGRLCASFEKMRRSLEQNNVEMWRQMEERKRLNAAFSHDLRTPLTVLKGQSEMLLKYVPEGRMNTEKVLATVETMQKHIARLEKYTETMNHLQRLEDIEISRKPCAPEKLIEEMRLSGSELCKGFGEKKLQFVLHTGKNAKQSGEVAVDIDAVMQVYENLISNAVRYAASKVSAHLSFEAERLVLIVADDGTGFSKKQLKDAFKPFYTTEGQTGTQHFGIGLNICKILTEKHGGYVQIFNSPGGTVKAVFGYI